MMRTYPGTEAGPISEATRQQRQRATRTVAGHPHDTIDCARLLTMLGLHPSEGRFNQCPYLSL